MADGLRPLAAHRKAYTVTFVRHGVQEELTFTCHTDAALFTRWLDYAGAGINAHITEERD